MKYSREQEVEVDTAHDLTTSPRKQAVHQLQVNVSVKAARYGATQEEWMHFSERLGLTEDLLPTVCNPNATRSPGSAIESPAKVPTVYNTKREYHGIRAWPEYRATPTHIAQWCKEPDYGLCIQSRLVRGIDIDVDDPEQAAPLIAMADRCLGRLPRRFREGSGRVLLAFQLAGDLARRRVKVVGGLLELMADRCEFVAAGMHKSGQRYEWRDGLPAEIPVITEAQLNEFWELVVMVFGEGESSTAAGGVRTRGQTIVMDDPAANYLQDAGLVLRTRRDGGFDVACPWEDQHTSGVTGDGSSTYFPAGVNGYTYGAFKCLHESHGPLGTRVFLREVGYVDDSESPEAAFGHLDDEDDKPEPSATGIAIAPAAPTAQLVSADGKYRKVSLAAVADVLRAPGVCGKRIGWDSFCAEVMVAELTQGEPQWRELTDVDNTCMREHLQRRCGFGNIPKELMRDTIEMVANENCFDSAQVWLGRLKWDGVARVDSFLTRYFGTADTPYTRALSRYIWTALAGRVLVPGSKADMVPVAVGKQGTGKTRTITAIAPSPDFYGELALDGRDADTARRLRGKVIVELAELSGLNKRDAESLKAMLSAVDDEWVPKYKERAVRNPRRALFFGSSNRDDFLVDDTGHRRWLPFESGQCDPEALRRDCEQVWAEGRDLFQANGIEYADAERLARAEHDNFTEVDEWIPVIAAWLDSSATPHFDHPGVERQDAEEALLGPPKAQGQRRTVVTALEVLQGALHMERERITRREVMRIAAVMKQLRWVPDRRALNGGGARVRVYLRPDDPVSA